MNPSLLICVQQPINSPWLQTLPKSCLPQAAFFSIASCQATTAPTAERDAVNGSKLPFFIDLKGSSSIAVWVLGGN